MKKSILLLSCVFFLSLSSLAQVEAIKKNLYQDSNGFFSLFKPDSWKISKYAEISRGKVKFISPNSDKINLIIIGEPNSYNSFNELLTASRNSDQRIKDKYKAYDVTVSSNVFTVSDIKYASSIITIQKMNKKYLTLDFIMENTHFSSSYSAPITSFDTYTPVIYECIYSLTPSSRTFTDQEITKALVESKIKQARFNIQMGLKDFALKYIEEGLLLDPNNKEMLELKSHINQ